MDLYEPPPSLRFAASNRIAAPARQAASSQLRRMNTTTAGQQQQQGGPRILPLPVWPEGTRLNWVDCSGQQLAPYTKNAPQHAVLALPGRPVTFLKDRVKVEQVTGKRDSYVNAFLIQSRGVRVSSPCSSCLKQMRRDPSSFANPFPHCIRLPGHFRGCCGNCKWRDHATRCSAQDKMENTWMPAPQRVTHAAEQPLALPAAGSRDDVPIVISEDESSAVSEFAPYDNEEAILPGENGGGDQDPKPEPYDDDDNEMDLVPIVDDGLAGDGTAEDPLRLD